MRAAGGCHCGAVRFEIEVSEEPEVLDCNCSICSASGYLHLVVPHADFTLQSGDSDLTSYRFGSGAANHLFCRICGVKNFYQPRSHPDCWSVNLRCLDVGTKSGPNSVTSMVGTGSRRDLRLAADSSIFSGSNVSPFTRR